MFAFIAAEKADYPISLMCRVLGVNRTSFHDWERRPPSDRELYDAFLLEKIREIHAASGGTYDSPRVQAELRLEHGIRVGRKRVERLMATGALKASRCRKRPAPPCGLRACGSLLTWSSATSTPPRRTACGADITYLPTWEGWLYLASVLDYFSRMIVGWCMLSHMRLELVERALEMAVARRRPEPGLIHHSDHGSQLGLNQSSQQCVVGRTVWHSETRLSLRRRERSECRSGDSRVRAV